MRKDFNKNRKCYECNKKSEIDSYDSNRDKRMLGIGLSKQASGYESTSQCLFNIVKKEFERESCVS